MQKHFKKLLLVALMTPALAMAQALSSAAKTAAAPAPIVISSAQKAAIKQLLSAIDASKLSEAIGENAQAQVKQIVPAVLSEALVDNKTLSNDQKRAVVPVLQKDAIPGLVKSAGKVFSTSEFKKDAIAAQYDAYARFYSVDEIKQLTAFYKSAVGQKFIAVQDKVGAQVVNSLMRKYMPEAIKDIRKKADAAVSKVKVPASK